MLVNSDCTIPKVIPTTSGGQLVIHNVGCIVPIHCHQKWKLLLHTQLMRLIYIKHILTKITYSNFSSIVHKKLRNDY